MQYPPALANTLECCVFMGFFFCGRVLETCARSISTHSRLGKTGHDTSVRCIFPVCVVYLAVCAVKLLLLLAFILGQQLHLSNNASSRNKTVRISTALSRVARRYTTPPREPLQVFSHCRTEKAPRQQDQEFFTAFPLGLSPPRLLKSAAVFQREG